MASYSDSLLVALKPNRTAYSILSPVGEVNCRPMPAPDCLEASSTQRVRPLALFIRVGIGLRDFYEEVSSDLPLLRKSRLVLDAILAQFHCPKGHPSGHIRFMNCAPEWNIS